VGTHVNPIGIGVDSPAVGTPALAWQTARKTNKFRGNGSGL
jgi:hypothetical protein